jgi:plasmid maintenance system antidote protein VapI
MPWGRRYPAAPMAAILRRYMRRRSLTWDEMAALLGVCQRSLVRYITADTLCEQVADRLACRIGLHPCLIWPEWFGDPKGVSQGSAA